MDLHCIQDTTLWKHLNSGFNGQDKLVASILSSNLISICKEASDRMKKCLVLHKEFTLHDETHLLRVTEIIAKILGIEGVRVLNPVEIFLLVLSSYYHDIGMILDDDEIESLFNNDDFAIFKANWIVEHPNYREIQTRSRDKFFRQHIEDSFISAYIDINNAMVTDYIRNNHATQSKQFVKNNYNNNPLWQVNGVNIAEFVGELCWSHNQDIQLLSNEKNFRVDENVATYNVNMPYLAILLRLSDILDFDKERTPDILYKSIHFTSKISLNEWTKHRSVMGWEISKDLIRFSVQCTHPIYQKTVLQFMDWIDEELYKAKSIISNFPKRVSYYKLNVPTKVDRSRIQPKENSYIYYDLEFSLSRDEIVKLLMMDELYNNPSLCVRELLQNSLDALRYRKHKIKSDLGLDWSEGKVIFKHYLDDFGREVLLCEDNGIGMDEDIIKNHLTKVGRSYYKSPIFKKEKESLKQKGIDFCPCSQFGIGFMSCFMVGDLITIKTRKDYGNGRPHGKPLIVEINGLNGIITIREGEEKQQIGTTISITGSRKTVEWINKVKLIKTLDSYALACEFPIQATCTINGIEDTNLLLPNSRELMTVIERTSIPSRSYKTYQHDLSEIHPNLKGKIKISFLVNESGKIAVENNEGKWDVDYKKDTILIVGTKPQNMEEITATCLDGILVCGSINPEDEGIISKFLNKNTDKKIPNVINLGRCSFLVDLRKNIKPDLSPARTPKKSKGDLNWRYIQYLMDIAEGILWAKVLEDISTKEEAIDFLKIAQIYNFDLYKLPAEAIWNKLYIPLKRGNLLRWEKMSKLEIARIDSPPLMSGLHVQLYANGFKIDPDYYRQLVSLFAKMSSLYIDNGQSILHILKPSEQYTPFIFFELWHNEILFMPYHNESNKYLSILSPPINSFNINHPLFQIALLENDETLSQFVITLVGIVIESIEDLMDGDTLITDLLGFKYQLVNWDVYPEDMKPEYRIWTEEHGELILTQEKFIEWASQY